MLRFKGSNYLRLRLVLSCLTGRPVRIDQIRADDEAPGLHSFEASFLRLVEKVSNGCVVEINETGATSHVLRYQSQACGILVRTSCRNEFSRRLLQVLNYDLGQVLLLGALNLRMTVERREASATSWSRCVSCACSANRCAAACTRPPNVAPLHHVYQVFFPVILASAMRVQSLGITLKGYTNAPLDESIDSFRAATLPLLKACGITATVSTRQRAVPPEGRAAVHVTVEALRSIEQPIRITEEGLVRRIRGVAWTVNMGPQNAKAAFSSAKGVLLKLLADVQIFTDVVTIKPKPVRSAPRGTCMLQLCHPSSHA